MDLRGIYLSNFSDRDGKAQSATIMTEWGFQGITFQYKRTFDLYGKIRDHTNDIHDNSKNLNFFMGEPLMIPA